MNTQTVEEQVAAFDEVLLLTLFDIILQISRELLKQTDLLDPKTGTAPAFPLLPARVPAGEKERSAFSRRNGDSPGKKNKNTGGMGVREKANRRKLRMQPKKHAIGSLSGNAPPHKKQHPAWSADEAV